MYEAKQSRDIRQEIYQLSIEGYRRHGRSDMANASRDDRHRPNKGRLRRPSLMTGGHVPYPPL